MLTMFALVLFLVDATVGAAVDEAVAIDDQILMGMRLVEGEELSAYREVTREIETKFADLQSPGEILETAEATLREISNTPAGDDVQWWLKEHLGQLIFEHDEHMETLTRSLLNSTNRELQSYGVGSPIFHSTDWFKSDALLRDLRLLLHDVDAPAPLRAAVVWLFTHSGRIRDIEAEVIPLATDHTNADLAHRVSSAYVVAFERDQAALSRIFYEGSGALREEAAVALCCWVDDPRLAGDIVETLGQVALDGSEPPEVRGQAIETIGFGADQARNRDILLTLLEPAHWFFGAQGQHFRIHSPANVIGGLENAQSDGVRARLEALRDQLPMLRSGEREYVEWVLENALGNHREIFCGPVEP